MKTLNEIETAILATPDEDVKGALRVDYRKVKNRLKRCLGAHPKVTLKLAVDLKLIKKMPAIERVGIELNLIF